MTDSLFLGSKNNADGNGSHEIKRCLLTGRKAMTNLDTALKADVPLPTKVCIVKAMVFPIVMQRCESWIKNKAEHQKIDAFWAVVLEKTLESPSDSKKIKPVDSKEKL